MVTLKKGGVVLQVPTRHGYGDSPLTSQIFYFVNWKHLSKYQHTNMSRNGRIGRVKFFVLR